MKQAVLKLKTSPKWFVAQIKLRKEIDRQIRKDSKGIIKHFKKNKWNLCVNECVESALQPILGSNVLSYIQAKHLELLTKKFPKAHLRCIEGKLLLSIGK